MDSRCFFVRRSLFLRVEFVRISVWSPCLSRHSPHVISPHTVHPFTLTRETVCVTRACVCVCVCTSMFRAHVLMCVFFLCCCVCACRSVFSSVYEINVLLVNSLNPPPPYPPGSHGKDIPCSHDFQSTSLGLFQGFLPALGFSSLQPFSVLKPNTRI